MKDQEQKFNWEELEDIWFNSHQSKNISIQISDFYQEVKSKASNFEKESISRDMALLKDHWQSYKGMVSEFEKDSVVSDLNMIKKILRKFLNLFKK